MAWTNLYIKPNKSAQKAAKRGLETRAKAPKSKKGGLDAMQAYEMGVGSGVLRARDIVAGKRVNAYQVNAFFNRHRHNYVNAKLKGLKPVESKAIQSWLLWGGEPLRKQAAAAVRKDKAKRNPVENTSRDPARMSDEDLQVELDSAADRVEKAVHQTEWEQEPEYVLGYKPLGRVIYKSSPDERFPETLEGPPHDYTPEKYRERLRRDYDIFQEILRRPHLSVVEIESERFLRGKSSGDEDLKRYVNNWRDEQVGLAWYERDRGNKELQARQEASAIMEGRSSKQIRYNEYLKERFAQLPHVRYDAFDDSSRSNPIARSVAKRNRRAKRNPGIAEMLGYKKNRMTKVRFQTQADSPVGGESMWVEVVKGDENDGIGILRNQPEFFDLADYGDMVQFGGGTDRLKPEFESVVECRSVSGPQRNPIDTRDLTDDEIEDQAAAISRLLGETARNSEDHPHEVDLPQTRRAWEMYKSLEKEKESRIAQRNPDHIVDLTELRREADVERMLGSFSPKDMDPLEESTSAIMDSVEDYCRVRGNSRRNPSVKNNPMPPMEKYHPWTMFLFMKAGEKDVLTVPNPYSDLMARKIINEADLLDYEINYLHDKNDGGIAVINLPTGAARLKAKRFMEIWETKWQDDPENYEETDDDYIEMGFLLDYDKTQTLQNVGRIGKIRAEEDERGELADLINQTCKRKAYKERAFDTNEKFSLDDLLAADKVEQQRRQGMEKAQDAFCDAETRFQVIFDKLSSEDKKKSFDLVEAERNPVTRKKQKDETRAQEARRLLGLRAPVMTGGGLHTDKKKEASRTGARKKIKASDHE